MAYGAAATAWPQRSQTDDALGQRGIVAVADGSDRRVEAGVGHPLFDADDAAVDVDDIRRFRLIGRAYWGERDLRGFAAARPGAEVVDMESEAHLILSGAFLGYLPDHMAAAFVAAGRLRAIAPRRFGYRAAFQLAHRPDRAREPRVAALLAALR